jgi:hypothetical protein
MERCNELCTKEATGQCAHCDALAERDRFWNRWFQGGVFIEAKNAVGPSVNKGLRWLRTHVQLALLTIVSLLFLIPLIYAWWLQLAQLDQSIICHVIFEKLQERNSALEMRLAEHHPSEPLFSGKLHFISVDPRHTGVSSVTVTRPQTTHYARGTNIINTTWDKIWNNLRPQVPENFEFVAETGGHQKFPFDSARFEFVLEFDPPLDFRVIRITNRVPGFVMPCSTLQASRPNARTFHLKFDLNRSPIILLFVAMLAVASIGFLVLIWLTAQLSNLATSMAAFFLSLWALRRILEPMIKTFPTLFDYGMLTICMLALLFVAWKVYFLKRPESGV